MVETHEVVCWVVLFMESRFVKIHVIVQSGFLCDATHLSAVLAYKLSYSS